jgi:hypothetical protein
MALSALQEKPKSGHGDDTDKRSKPEVDVMCHALAWRLRKADSTGTQYVIERSLPRHDEVGERPVKKHHQQPEEQSCDIDYHRL